MAATVLYADAHWLGLDKPAGMVTTPPSARGRPTLVDAAREHSPSATHLHPLSRLDADVTGVVLFALTHEAVERAVQARAEGRYRRLYLGVTSPAPTDPWGSWRWPVAIDPRDRTHRTTEVGLDAQEARTDYEVIAGADGVALVVFVPVTGRTHQIRVHARAAGVPLAGDIAYGGVRRVVRADGSVASASRAMLHAWRVRIPASGRLVEAPVAEDLRALWEACGGAAEVFAAWRETKGRMG